ncbi:MAG: hypothetical protein HY014_00775 [Acidobacteria bacterium]|nr:hypothetical protein [Acidobacteriota bacterium]MBI3486686.1 hypothetical protein [Acidobacteriota bacterium]
MRVSLCLCLAAGLLAGEPPRPGLDRAFLAHILADSEQGAKPWKTFRVPEDSAASATVEVVGELTPAEYRQMAFQEFLVWFREDLKRFWREHGAGDAVAGWAEATMPVTRYGGNPVPQNAPLGRLGF